MKDLNILRIVVTICIITLIACCILDQVTISNYRETCRQWNKAYIQMEYTANIYKELYKTNKCPPCEMVINGDVTGGTNKDGSAVYIPDRKR